MKPNRKRPLLRALVIACIVIVGTTFVLWASDAGRTVSFKSLFLPRQ